MQNFNKTLELQSTEAQSAGNAMDRYGVYATSTRAKIDDFVNTLQKMWQSALNSSVINGVIDSGTKVLNVISAIVSQLGAIPTIASSITAVTSLLGKNAGIFTPINFSKNDSGDWVNTGFLSNFSKSIKETQQSLNQLSFSEADKWITQFNQETNNGTQNLSQFYEKCKDPSLVNYFNNLKGGTATVQGYTEATKAANVAIESEGVVSKVTAVGLKALSLAGNMILITAISYGLEKLVEYISSLKSASEQAKEDLDTANQNLSDSTTKVNDLNTKLQDTNKQIETLKAKGTLTFVEQSQLTTLEKTSAQLQTQLEITQALQKVNEEKQTNAAVKSVNTQNDEKINPLTGAVDTEVNSNPFGSGHNNTKSGIDGVNEALSFYSSRMEQVKKDQDEYNSLTAKGNQLTDEEKQKKEALAYILKDDDSTTLTANLLNRAKAYQEEANEIDVDIASNKQEAQQAKESALEQANAILKVVDAPNYAKSQTTSFNSVWNSNDYKSVVNDLKALSSQGKLTTDTLNQSKFQSFSTAMANAGVTAKDTVTQINALNRSTSDNSDASEQAATSNQDLANSLEGLMKSNVANYQTLQTALDNVKSYGTLSSNDLNSVLKVFPDMSSAVLEYNSGLKTTAQMTDLIKQKMQSLQSSYTQELDQGLAKNTDFYNSTITKHTALINELKNTYGIDYQNYSTYEQLKDATNKAILSVRMGNEDITVSSLAQKYLANVTNYSNYESAKQNIATTILNSIKNLNSAQITQLAAIYGVDVKQYANTESAKPQIAAQLANKVSQIWAATSSSFADTLKTQVKSLQDEYNNFSNSLGNHTNSGDTAYLNNLKSQINSLNGVIKSSSGDTSDVASKINEILTGINTKIPDTTSALKSAASEGKKDAKDAATALKDQYEAQLKVIEANKSKGNYKPDKYGVEGLQYYQALLALQNQYKNSQLDADDKVALQTKVVEAQKAYEQSILDTSYKELDTRKENGQVLAGSKYELNNLNSIQKLLNSSNMSLVDTQATQLEQQKRMYQWKKDSLELESTQLENQVKLGNIREGTPAYLNQLLKIKQDIANSDLNAIDKEDRLEKINEEIYSTQNSINEAKINYVDYLVSTGKLQENSLAYIRQLQSLESSLNLTYEQRQSLQEKIFSAEKSYISQLESDLSDESIEGSYGYQLKQIQDQIDALNNENTAYEKQIALQKAEQELAEASQQKSVMMYHEGSGFIYEADQQNVNDKQQALTDAQRAEQIEKLNEQKESIQKEEESMKSELESSLNELEGKNNQSWSKIQNQISKVIDNVGKVFKKHTSDTKSDFSEIDDALNDSTDNTQNDYQKQSESMKKYLEDLKTLEPQILSHNKTIADSYNNIANALHRIANEYANAEENRENANYRYYEYNKELKANHESVKYASGTDSSIGGVVQTDEEGYEAKFSPTENGTYTLLDAGTKIFTAQDTSNLRQFSSNPTGFLSGMLSSITSRINPNNIVKNTSHNSTVQNTVSMAGAKFEFPNVIDGQSFVNELQGLPLLVGQKLSSTN